MKANSVSIHNETESRCLDDEGLESGVPAEPPSDAREMWVPPSVVGLINEIV